jgi:hypothetical protein
MYRWPRFAFSEISAGDFDIAIVGQLPATHLAFGYQFEIVGFEAPLGCRALREHALKDPPADAHNASIFADLNAEFDGHSIGVPPGILGKCEKHGGPPLAIGPCSCIVLKLANGDWDVESGLSRVVPQFRNSHSRIKVTEGRACDGRRVLDTVEKLD